MSAFEDWYAEQLNAELERAIARVDVERPPPTVVPPLRSPWSGPRREEPLLRLHRDQARALEVLRVVVTADDGAEFWRLALVEMRDGRPLGRLEVRPHELTRVAQLFEEAAQEYREEARARALEAREAAE